MRMALTACSGAAPAPARHMPTRRLPMFGIGTEYRESSFVVEGERTVAPPSGGWASVRAASVSDRASPEPVGGARVADACGSDEADVARELLLHAPRGGTEWNHLRNTARAFPYGLLVSTLSYVHAKRKPFLTPTLFPEAGRGSKEESAAPVPLTSPMNSFRLFRSGPPALMGLITAA